MTVDSLEIERVLSDNRIYRKHQTERGDTGNCVIFRIICRGSSTLFVVGKALEGQLEPLDPCGMTNRAKETAIFIAEDYTQWTRDLQKDYQ